MNMPCLRQAIEYVFTYFGWGYLYFSAGYFWCDEFNTTDVDMRKGTRDRREIKAF